MKKALKYGGIAMAVMLIVFFLLDLVFPFHPQVEFAPVVRDRNGKVLHLYTTSDQQWRMAATLNEISPKLKKAIIFREDKYFAWHPGVNPLAMLRALGGNIIHFRRTSGASTITMQVARMLDRKPRTYINKCIEIFRALQLEKNYTKDEIFQFYINLAPYGSNIQGVKAASILYFDKDPEQLSLAEITSLSVIPNRPNAFVIGRDNASIIKERNKWLRNFGKAKLFDAATIADAIAEPLTAYRHEAANKAPQFSLRMRRMYPQLQSITTTLDAAMQQKAEDITAGYVNGLKLQGIYNAATIVVNNTTHEVLAYVGSSDFNDKYHNGQVDGIRGIRSPGSALKPLLYGLAFDRGLVTPKTIITDVPINIGGYSPENYDLGYRGNVTVEDALRQSLNIPAVKTLDRVGVPFFLNAMSGAGFTTLKNAKQKPGLSVILGSCGVRADEMVALYSSFANGGVYNPLVWLKDNAKHKSKERRHQVLSAAATYMVSTILRELHRPDLPNMYETAKDIPHIAWKTGTSYGRKDAWSVGYNEEYTIVVWCGNFNGDGAAALNGAGTATPLLFQLFAAYPAKAVSPQRVVPQQVNIRMVCNKTGKLPADFCTELVADFYIPGISSNEVCDHRKEVKLAADESFSYCTSCMPQTGYKVKQYPNIAPDLAAWYEMAHISYEKIPAHNPACGRVFDGKAPVITSLQNGLTYLITDKGKQQLQLSCNAANDVQEVFWYINDHFYKRSGAQENILFYPQDRNIKISCTDDKGRNADIKVKVDFI